MFTDTGGRACFDAAASFGLLTIPCFAAVFAGLSGFVRVGEAGGGVLRTGPREPTLFLAAGRSSSTISPSSDGDRALRLEEGTIVAVRTFLGAAVILEGDAARLGEPLPFWPFGGCIFLGAMFSAFRMRWDA